MGWNLRNNDGANDAVVTCILNVLIKILDMLKLNGYDRVNQQVKCLLFGSVIILYNDDMQYTGCFLSTVRNFRGVIPCDILINKVYINKCPETLIFLRYRH
ncbi:hypothetical protein NQ317_015635 [Molorchus minor]|uniref:Uncharacterized protein n=1 Tax=Molorchus minor TaxID=1323400 RepID=A0ABQ9JTS6_9CUCU|nr:hypothetical protein NQ317_015635 [Molorchus minor]